MNKLYYINLFAFVFCLIVLIEGNVTGARFFVLSSLSFLNIIIFANFLLKDRKKHDSLSASKFL